MRKHLLDSPLGLTILLMWAALVVLAVATYLIVRGWKRRHPPPKPEPVQSYSKRLLHRMNKGRTGAAPSDAKQPGKHYKH